MNQNATDHQYDIFVTIGTDHHQFGRLIDWVDEWLEEHPQWAERTLVQHGQSRQSRLAHNTGFIEYDDLMTAMHDATAVVVHGGPASVFESRAQGHLPVCIPRDPDRDEVVDDHQQRFARHLAEQDMLLLCEDRETFRATLDRVVADPGFGRVTEDPTRLYATFENLEAVVSGLAPRPGLRAQLTGLVARLRHRS